MQTLLSRFNGAALTSPAALRREVWGAVFLLIALLGYTSAGTADWVLERILIARTPAAAAPAARAEAAVRQRRPISAFDPILSGNIFHARRSSGPALATAPAGAAPANVAPLKLTLSGIFLAGRTGFAMIVGPDGRTEQVYQPGDCVPRLGDDQGQDCTASQGRLARVQADRIVVNFGGQPTVFMLEEGTDSGPHAPSPAAAPGTAAAPAAGGQFPTARSGNTIEMHIPNAEVEKSFENFAEIIKQARVVPYSKDGVTVGFQIQNIVPGSVFQRIGLQNFDVIKSVNNESLTTADQALRLFSVFRNEKEFSLDVQRGGQQVKLSYFID